MTPNNVDGEWQRNVPGHEEEIKDLFLEIISKHEDSHAEFCRLRGEQYKECLQCVLEKIILKVEEL